jgi:uncharacterized protein (DUF885 family)
MGVVQDGRPGVAEVGDRWFAGQCRLDPARAVLAGWTGHNGALPDYSPDGFAERAALSRGALLALDALAAGRRPEPVTATVLRERLEAEAAYAESGLAARLSMLASPPVLIREALARADEDTRARLLATVPTALSGYLATLRHEAALGRPANRVQAEVVAGAAVAWAGEFTDESVAAAYGEFAEGLRRDVLPLATEDGGVGSELYQVAARHTLGIDLDLAGTHDWLVDQLEVLRAETEELAGGDLAELVARFDADPAWLLRGADALRDWALTRLAVAADVAAWLLDVPDALREIDVEVIPGGAAPVHYLPPAADLSRAGRVCWPVPPGDEPIPVWGQVTMLHHEGVPGHHLQLGGAVLDKGLPEWQRHTTVAGHAEGWAVYAESLMLEVLETAPRLGYLMGLRANAAVALVDLGVHAGLPAPDGAQWTPDTIVAFLGEHTTIPEPMRHFTTLRATAWPGQALAYSCGAREWQAAIDRVADDPSGHARLLGLGPCGLAVLRDL